MIIFSVILIGAMIIYFYFWCKWYDKLSEEEKKEYGKMMQNIKNNNFDKFI